LYRIPAISLRSSIILSVCQSAWWPDPLSICPSVCLCISPSVGLSICLCLSNCPFVFVYLTVHLSLSIWLSICQSVHLSICWSVHLSVCLFDPVSISTSLSDCQSVHLSICWSVHLSLSIWLSICPPLCPIIMLCPLLSVCPFIHQSISNKNSTNIVNARPIVHPTTNTNIN
jgi:hypothetical protein